MWLSAFLEILDISDHPQVRFIYFLTQKANV